MDQAQSIVCPNCGELVANMEVCASCQRPIGSHYGERGYFMGKAIGPINKPWLFLSTAIAIAAASLGFLALRNNPALSKAAFAVSFTAAIAAVIAKVSESRRRL